MWLVLGLVLLVVELVTPSGFFVMFFGLGALTVGVLTSADLAGPAWLQWLIFTIASVAYLLLFRRRLQGRFDSAPGGEMDTLVGELVTPKERIAPGGVGRVELRGTSWNARNDAPVTVAVGQRCRVVGVDGLVVFIQPE
jgi:membrane protein implicated in regulation of membrane protease activity